MPPTRSNDESDRRPTLPSIHTLNLPLLSGPAWPNVPYEHHDNMQRIPNRASQHERRFSTSSSVTNVSRDSSPSPSPKDEYPSNPFASGKPVRLRPCPLAEADAIIFVGPPVAVPPQQSNYSPRQTKEPSMLVFGASVDEYKRNPRPLARGSRIHPYRIVRSPPPSDRRSSVIMITPLPVPRRRL